MSLLQIFLTCLGGSFLIFGFIGAQFYIHEADEQYYEAHPEERPNYPW